MKAGDSGAKKSKGRPKGSTRGGLTGFFTMKMSPEYKVWLKAFAKHIKGEMSDVFRDGAELLAEQRGFRPPPPK